MADPDTENGPIVFRGQPSVKAPDKAAAGNGAIVFSPTGGNVSAGASAEVPSENRSILGGPINAPEGSMVHGPLSNRPDDTYLDSAVKGTLTVLGRVPFMPAGILGDLRDTTRYVTDRAAAAIRGVPYADQVRANQEYREKLKKTTLPSLTDMMPTTGQLSDEFFRQLNSGKYEPTTTLGKILMGGLEAGLGTASVGSLGSKITPGAVPSTVMRTTDKMALPAVGAGAAGTAAAEYTGDPLVGMGVNMGYGPVQGTVVKQGQKFIPAFTKSGVQRQADKTIVDTASDPEAVAGYTKPPGELAPATTGTATGDRGLVIAERTLSPSDPKLMTGIKEIEAAANTARVKTIEDLGDPNVRPKDLADHFVNRKAAIEQEADAAVAAAEARQQAAVTPEGKPIEDIGSKALDEGRLLAERSKKDVDSLYTAVDPDGTLNAVSKDMVDAAKALLASRDPHIPEGTFFTPFVKPVMEAMLQLPQVVPFQTFKNFDTWVSGQIQMARRAGDNNSARQLGALKTSITKGMHNVLENQVEWERGQVAAGQMRPEDTIGARFKADAEAFMADRKGAKASATAAVLGPNVVPPPTPNMTPGTAVLYQQAKRAHQTHMQTFEEGVVGKALGMSGYENKQTPAQVAASIFRPGDEGATNVNSWMRAAATGGEQPGSIHAAALDMATTRLREMLPGPGHNSAGMVTPEVLARWKATYANALRAIDQHMPGFSSRFDDTASATQALGEAAAARTRAVTEFQKSTAGHLARLTSGDDVTHHIGNLISDKSGGTKVEALVRTAMQAVNPDGTPNGTALAGIQSAAVDWMLGKTANAGMAAGENLISSPKMRALVRERSDALRHIFGDQGLENIQRVVDSLERDAHAVTAGGMPGPDTARKLQPVLEALANQHQTVGPLSLGAVLMDLQYSGGAATGAILLNSIRQWLVQRGIRNSHELVRAGLLDPELGAIMARRGLDEKGVPDAFVLSDMAALMQTGRLGASMIAPGEEEQRNMRQGRARGGRTSFKIDCEARASKLCREAELIRRRHGGQTKALLGLNDNAVADALRVANRGL